MCVLLDGGDSTTTRAASRPGAERVERRLGERWSAEADARGGDSEPARARASRGHRDRDEERGRGGRGAGEGGLPLGERERPPVAVVPVEVARGPRDVRGLEAHRGGEDELEERQAEHHERPRIPHGREPTAVVTTCQIRPRSVATGAMLKANGSWTSWCPTSASPRRCSARRRCTCSSSWPSGSAASDSSASSPPSTSWCCS